MYSIAPPIQELIRALRATAMPWIGDQIEEHIRIGNVPLFTPGVDDQKEIISQRQSAHLGGTQRSASSTTEQFVSPEDSEGTGFSFEEQISEAINIIESNICDRIVFADDAARCIAENFNTDNVSLALIDDEGESIHLLTQQSREAATELIDVIVRLRDWLISQAPSTDLK